ncbi:hypothetical protein ACWC09_26465 [Streptomyces sp. NPDC001617]
MTGLECRDCHRRLKNPSPTGYGPTCARKRGLTTPRAVRRPKPATVPPAHDAIPGQTELELVYLQPTLDSL